MQYNYHKVSKADKKVEDVEEEYERNGKALNSSAEASWMENVSERVLSSV